MFDVLITIYLFMVLLGLMEFFNELMDERIEYPTIYATILILIWIAMPILNVTVLTVMYKDYDDSFLNLIVKHFKENK